MREVGSPAATRTHPVLCTPMSSHSDFSCLPVVLLYLIDAIDVRIPRVFLSIVLPLTCFLLSYRDSRVLFFPRSRHSLAQCMIWYQLFVSLSLNGDSERR